jgi:hypothetical protein
VILSKKYLNPYIAMAFSLVESGVRMVPCKRWDTKSISENRLKIDRFIGRSRCID